MTVDKYQSLITNFQPLFDDLILDHSCDFLWLLYNNNDRINLQVEIEKLQNNKTWNSRQNIFLLDCENCFCNDTNYWDQDDRINVFCPCVSDHPRCHLFLFWFNWMQEAEKYLNFSQKLTTDAHKKYMFECLLGTGRQHKDFVRDKINQSNFYNKFLLGDNGTPAHNQNAKWEKGCSEEDESRFVTYNHVQKIQSPCTIPYLIYNQTYYSIVCETAGDGCAFYTEKTGKVLLGKRLFIMFSSYHQLKNLKDFGFKTFNGIIDESYDDIKDSKKRHQAAWEQVEFLLKLDPILVQKSIQPILEHNYNHFITTDWQKDMHKKIQNISQSSK